MFIGDIETAQMRLHAQYGPVVRIAHNEASCSDPAVIPTIYPTQKPLAKTHWYTAFRAQGISEHADLFTETDEEKHQKYRKIVQPAYQMSSVLKNESAIDQCTALFLQRLDDFAEKRKPFDLGLWLEMYAEDAIGHVLFGRTFGFLDTGTDVGAFMEALESALPLLHISAAAPKYMRIPIMMSAMLVPGTLKSFKAVGRMADDAKVHVNSRMKESREEIAKRSDILSQLFNVMYERGSEIGFTHKEITLESWAGLLAGADSVATILRAVFYYLMKNPSTYQTAFEEIKKANYEGLLSTPVTYTETTSHLPYLCASIKEATRLFPSFAIHMGRVSPAQGLDLGGYYIPAGYWAGCNSMIVQRNKEVFGEDAGDFRPERWLESQERSFAMEKGMLVFGAGTRTCVGRNIASAELHKLIPEVLRRFDVEMAHNRPWRTHNAGFIKQKDILVNITAREA